MQKKNDKVSIYASWVEGAIIRHDIAYAERLIAAVVMYGIYGEIPDKSDKELYGDFVTIQPVIDNNIQSSKFGKRGGRPRKYKQKKSAIIPDDSFSPEESEESF